MNNAVLTVIGKDRVGIVFEVAKLLAEKNINIVNISQQLMDDFFTMIVLVDTQGCVQDYASLSEYFVAEGQNLGLDIRLQHNDLFTAMHRI